MSKCKLTQLETEPKNHYRMHKVKKNWVVKTSLISGLILGGTLLSLGTANVETYAAENNSPATAEMAEPTTTAASDENAATKETPILTEAATNDSETTSGTAADETAATPKTVEEAAEEAAEETAAVEEGTATTETIGADEKTAPAATEAETLETPAADPETAPTDETTTEETTANPYWEEGAAPKNESSLVKGNVVEAWQEGYHGEGVVVAVIDSAGQDHKDLVLSDPSKAAITQDEAEALIAEKGYGEYISDKIPFAYNYGENSDEIMADGSPHGEHVTGIIAANGSDDPTTPDVEDYVVGVAPEAQILSLRVISNFPDEYPSDIAKAIYDAVDLGADVIQMSLGIGTALQDSTDEEQEAVEYAIQHGVFVSVSASNNGTGANGGATDETDDYDAVNTDTIADPGVSENAMTVAAENDGLGADSEIADFSSWGPTPDFSLKPDITAPGVDIWSTVFDNQYQQMSGTSMAGPFDAGAAALVMQRLKETTNLTGAQLVLTAKLALMNSADPIDDAAYPGVVLSPRQEGAGAIDVAGAQQMTVSGQGEKSATGSVSLYNVGETTSFNIVFTNYGNTDVAYTYDAGDVLTQAIDTANGNTAYDVALDGAAVTGETSFTVRAGETVTKTFTLHIADGTAKDQIVEGYLKFTADDGRNNISIPYLAYYGDVTDEEVFDVSKADITSYLADEDNLPLGLGDQADTLGLYIANGGNNLTLSTKVDPNKVAFSPNGDGQTDEVLPYIYSKAAFTDLKAEILDQDGQVVAVVDQERNVQRSYVPDGSVYLTDLNLSPSMRQHPDALAWDGMVYNQATGKEEAVADGKYTYRVTGTLASDGANQVQNIELPVIVDTQKPEITGAALKGDTLTFDYTDAGAGFTENSHVTLTINGANQLLALGNDGKANNGSFSYQLTDAQRAELNGAITISLTDVAGNTGTTLVESGGTAATATGETAVNEPYFAFVVPAAASTGGNDLRSYGTTDPFTAFINASADKFTVQAVVNQDPGAIVSVHDIFFGQIYTPVSITDGVATFEVYKANGETQVFLAGSTTLAGAEAGEYLTSQEDSIIIFVDDKLADAGTLLAGSTADADSTRTAVEADKGTPVIVTADTVENEGHSLAESTLRAEPTAGITFNEVNDNTYTYLGVDSKAYDPSTGMLTITGKLDDPTQKLVMLTNSSSYADPANVVDVAADGTFSVEVPYASTEQKAFGYLIYPAGSTDYTYGRISVILDTAFPTIDVPEAATFDLAADGNYLITTSSPVLTIKGAATDNSDGYFFLSNGDMLYREKTGGVNRGNIYAAYDFNQTYELKEGINYITLTAEDQVGNITTKVFEVFYTPAVVKTVQEVETAKAVPTAAAVPAAAVALAAPAADQVVPAGTEALPKMGEQSSSTGVIAGLMVLLGLGFLVKRKEEQR